jgi:hypothetical protein
MQQDNGLPTADELIVMSLLIVRDLNAGCGFHIPIYSLRAASEHHAADGSVRSLF